MTREQRAASDPALSAWVTASAGAGKTKTLTDRVTRLILSGAAPSSILCVTFTKAAAAEMLDRIEARLHAIVKRDDESLRRLSDEEGVPPLTPDEARRLAFDALERPPRALTLHSFAQSLLRRFPEECGYAPGAGFADETEAAEMLRAATAAVLSAPQRYDVPASAVLNTLREAGTEDVLLERLRPFAASGEETDPAETEARMRRFLGAPETPESASRFLLRTVPPRGELRDALLQDAARLEAKGGVNDRKLADALRETLARLQEADAPEESAIFTPPEEALPGHAAIRTCEAYAAVYFTGTGEPRKSLCGKAVQTAFPETAERLESEQRRMIRALEETRALRCAERSVSLLQLGAAAGRAYRELKRTANIMDFDDMIRLTAALLRESEAAMTALYETDKRVKHLLLDEAQDTSPVQWDIVTKITEECLSGAQEHAPRDRRSLFIVGDEKQSIYRFQGADRARYLEMRAYFARAAREAGIPYEDIPLHRSFRCAPAILRFTDEVFAPAGPAAALTDDPEGVRHAAARTDARGTVILYPTLKATAEEDETEEEAAPYASEPAEENAGDGWILPEERGAKPGRGETTARFTADLIARMLNARAATSSRPQGLRPQDFMILLQKREPLTEALRRALAEKGVPVALPDRFEPAAHQAARDLMCYLECAYAPPGDDLALATALRSPLFRFPDPLLEKLCAARGDAPLRDALEQAASQGCAASAEALSRLNEAAARARAAGPFRFLLHALYSEGHLAAMHERFGQEAEEAVKHFLHLAERFEERAETPDHGAFLREAKSRPFSVKREPGGEEAGVRILTVHASKGLQSPVVILPDLADVKRSRDSVLFLREGFPLYLAAKAERCEAERDAALREEQADEAERLRLFYVALTRAQDELHLLGALSARRKNPPPGCRYLAALEAMTRLQARARDDGAFILSDGD